MRHRLPQEEAESQRESQTSYHSPAAQAAIAIREWKARRREKQLQRHRPKFLTLLGKSGNSV
jgi:hypothetical protein